MRITAMIDMGFASHYWIMFVIFGAAVLIITTLYFFLAWLPAYLPDYLFPVLIN